MANILPDFKLAVVVDGVRYEVRPSPLAMIEWERHCEKPIWKLLTTSAPAEELLRLCWHQLKVDGDRSEALPPFDDWVALVSEVSSLDDDGDGVDR